MRVDLLHGVSLRRRGLVVSLQINIAKAHGELASGETAGNQNYIIYREIFVRRKNLVSRTKEHFSRILPIDR